MHQQRKFAKKLLFYIMELNKENIFNKIVPLPKTIM